MTNPQKNLRNYTTRGGGRFARNESETDAHKNSPTADQPHTGGDVLHLTVPGDCGGLRLDQALARLFPEYSRSRLQDWIAAQQVRLDGEFATAKCHPVAE